MFGLGFWEIAIILAVALIVLGPSKLPELARGLGKGLREFRKATEDFKSTIEGEVNRPEPPRPRLETEPSAQILPPEGSLPQTPPQVLAPPLGAPETESTKPVAGPVAAEVAAWLNEGAASAPPAGASVAPAPSPAGDEPKKA